MYTQFHINGKSVGSTEIPDKLAYALRQGEWLAMADCFERPKDLPDEVCIAEKVYSLDKHQVVTLDLHVTTDP
jgi:hypothetical protein